MIAIEEVQALHFMVLPQIKFKSPSEQNFSISLSGIAKPPPPFYGGPDGRTDTITIKPDFIGMTKVINRVAPFLPPFPDNDRFYGYAFVPLQWTVYASFNSIYTPVAINHQGDTVDDWKLIRESKRDVITNTDVNVFSKLSIDLEVRSGYIFKVGYELNMYGYFIIYSIPDID